MLLELALALLDDGAYTAEPSRGHVCSAFACAAETEPAIDTALRMALTPAPQSLLEPVQLARSAAAGRTVARPPLTAELAQPQTGRCTGAGLRPASFIRVRMSIGRGNGPAEASASCQPAPSGALPAALTASCTR